MCLPYFGMPWFRTLWVFFWPWHAFRSIEIRSSHYPPNQNNLYRPPRQPKTYPRPLSSGTKKRTLTLERGENSNGSGGHGSRNGGCRSNGGLLTRLTDIFTLQLGDVHESLFSPLAFNIHEWDDDWISDPKLTLVDRLTLVLSGSFDIDKFKETLLFSKVFSR